MIETNKKEKYKDIKKESKVQLTCPKCKYEFPFNLGEVDTKREELGRDIRSIMEQLTKFKLLSPEEQQEKLEWKRRTVYKLECLRKECRDLKTKSKGVHDELTRQNYSILKQVIRDFYGDKEFARCINEVIERGKAYNLSSTMALDNYTHSKGTVLKKV